jgi:class 3 adenylate cyclase
MGAPDHDVIPLGAAEATLRRPEVALRLLTPMLVMLRERHGDAAVDDIVRGTGLDPAVLEDEEAWVSVVFHHRFRDSVLKHLYDLDAPPPPDHAAWQLWREAGRFGFERQMLGALWPVLRAFGHPGLLYRRIPREVRHGNTVLDARVLVDRPGAVTLEMRPREAGYEESVDFCWNRVGVLEGAPRIWGLPFATVRHPRCMHDPSDPADACVYEVAFTERGAARVAQAAASAAVGAGAGLALAGVLATPAAVAVGAGALIGLGVEGWRRRTALRRAQKDDDVRVRALLEHADRRYAELWAEGEELRTLTLQNRQIAAYLPSELVSRLRDRQLAPRLGGAKREVTVLFTDLRGYSTITEHLDPDDVIRLLNDCFGALSADVRAHGGTVLEFLGDGLLAVFGAPGHLPDHAEQAVRAAGAMMGSMERLNDAWVLTGRDRLWQAHGMRELGLRVGVHTGTVVAGNLGSETQMKYAVVGDAVNVAARLEQLNKTLNTTIAVSAETRARLSPALQRWLEPLGAHPVKGRSQPVTVYGHSPAPHG